MSEISKINNIILPSIMKNNAKSAVKTAQYTTVPEQNLTPVSADNLKAYIPSFTARSKDIQPSRREQIKAVKAQLDKESTEIFNALNKKGILDNNDSNDGSTVLDNLYKIATEERIQGLSSSQILKDVLKSIDNPYTITQKFGDIPTEVREEYRSKTGQRFPDSAVNIMSSSCVVASMEFNLAQRKPAEFARFAAGLSSSDYKVSKKIKISNISNGNFVSAISTLREFNTDSQIYTNWEDVNINIRPDRNAIVRARVQSSYKDPGERSVVDVLIQSALLNLGSQHAYDALTDERKPGKYNDDTTGLSNVEKNFVEEVLFEAPKISVVYQNIDENGYLTGYNAEPDEVKQHILKSLSMGQNVIIGYTHIDANKQINGGHEITVIGYEEDNNGNGFFICNDTDDGIDEPIRIDEKKLIPLIHHAGITRDALSEKDFFDEELWVQVAREINKAA